MTHIGLFGAGVAAAYVAGTERQVFKENDKVTLSMASAQNGRCSGKRSIMIKARWSEKLMT